MESLALSQIIDTVQRTMTLISAGVAMKDSEGNGYLDQLAEQLERLKRICAALNLPMTSIATARAAEKLSEFQRSKRSVADIRAAADALQRPVNVLKDETSLRFYFHLPEPSRQLYAERAPFGSRVQRVFPAAIMDVEEAAKCLALERATASVFHSMRAVEFGLKQVIGESFGDTGFLDQVSTWGAIQNRIRREANRPDAEISPLWAGKQDRLMKLALLVHQIADAFRHPTVHCVRTYTVDQAEDVFQATGSFLRRLSEDLDREADREEVDDPAHSESPRDSGSDAM